MATLPLAPKKKITNKQLKAAHKDGPARAKESRFRHGKWVYSRNFG